MSANIKSMFYVGQRPWHELGTKLEKAPTAEEAIKAAGLDWEVICRPVYDKLPSGEFKAVAGRQLIVRADTDEVLGDMGERFTPLQNKEAFSQLDDALREIKATYETAGCLGNGAKVWILAKLPGDIIVGKDDLVKKYILLAHAHDGSLAVRELITPVRVVCQNTLNESLSGANASNSVYARHTKGVAGKTKAGLERLLTISGIYDQLGQLYGRMLARQMKGAEVEAYFRKVIGLPANDAPDTKPSRVLVEMSERFEGPLNTIGTMRGTLWAAYNAVTESIDHGGRSGELEARANSLLFGPGATRKIKALELAKTLV